MFTITNISLPLITIVFIILWIKTKNIVNTSLLILSFTSLMNMIAHLFVLPPIDRYQFYGYVLNLLILSIGIVYLTSWILNKYFKNQ